MSRCAHDFVNYAWSGGRWEVVLLTAPDMTRCRKCGDYASLGQASDEGPAVRAEIRAAYLAHGENNEAEFTDFEWMGYGGDEVYCTSPPLEWHHIDDAREHKRDQWHAGYLAAVIAGQGHAEHDKEAG